MRFNFSWTLAGQVVYAITQWGVLTAFARFGSASMVGEYAWSLAITAPLIILASLSLRDAQATDLEGQFHVGTYLCLSIVTNGIAILGLFIALTVTNTGTSSHALIVIVAATKAIEAVSDIIYGFFQRQEKMDTIAKSLSIRGIASLLIGTGTLAVTGDVVLSVLLMGLESLAVLLVFDLPAIVRFHGQNHAPLRVVFGGVSGHSLQRLFRLTLPLGIAAALISLNINITAYFVGASGGAESLGIYTVLSYPLIAGNLPISALSASALPKLTQLHTSANSASFLKLLGGLVAFAILFASACTVLGWKVGGTFLEVFFGPVYASEAAVFTVLVFGMGIGFVNWFMNSALIATRQFNSALVLQIISLVSTVCLSLLLIPTYGIMGAAWTTVIVLILNVAMKALVIVRKFTVA